MLTHTNLARLAAWAGITPETHPDIFMEPFIYHDVSSFASIEWCPLDAPNLPNPTDPGEDPREVDRAWLAEVVNGFFENNIEFSINGEGDLAAPSVWVRSVCVNVTHNITLALLLAARAAGVPEAVAVMGDES